MTDSIIRKSSVAMRRRMMVGVMNFSFAIGVVLGQVVPTNPIVFFAILMLQLIASQYGNADSNGTKPRQP